MRQKAQQIRLPKKFKKNLKKLLTKTHACWYLSSLMFFNKHYITGKKKGADV